MASSKRTICEGFAQSKFFEKMDRTENSYIKSEKKKNFPKMSVAKTWIFTLNNYTEEECKTLETWGDDVNRMVVSKETGEEETPHLQGAVTFSRAYRLSALKKLLPRAHWEKAKAKDCFLYSKKVGSVMFINVNNKRQGARTDLEEVKTDILAGASDRTLWQDHFSTMVKYHRGIKKGKAFLKPVAYAPKYSLDDFPWDPILDWERSVILYGEPGIGKTQFAKAHFKCALFINHMDQLMDFDPETHEGIVFDDMDFKHMPRTAQIHILDQEEARAIHIRYTTAYIPEGTHKVFTTNEPDGEIFAIDDGAIARRVNIRYLESWRE